MAHDVRNHLTVRQLREALAGWTGNEDAHVTVVLPGFEATPFGIAMQQNPATRGSDLFVILTGEAS